MQQRNTVPLHNVQLMTKSIINFESIIWALFSVDELEIESSLLLFLLEFSHGPLSKCILFTTHKTKCQIVLHNQIISSLTLVTGQISFCEMKETPQQLEAGVVTLISLLSSLGCLNVIFLSRP